MKDGNILLSVQVAIDALGTALEQLDLNYIETGLRGELEEQINHNFGSLVKLKYKLKDALNCSKG